jgi:uncharacterized protein (TIGR00299 family) protein
MAMKCGYFDCFSGAAGDMILGALIDAGCPLEALRGVIAGLALPGVRLHAEPVQCHGLAATRARVVVDPGSQTTHRHLPEIVQVIDGAGLDARVAGEAKAVFQRLAEAEAAAHGIAVEQVHFHEVGAADAIVDIVGACAGLALLGVERVVCSPIPTGSGTVACAHGVLPVPAPATARLLQGCPVRGCDEPGELTTPTGAALLTTLAEEYGPLPAMRIEAVGCGAGTREGTTRANILRLFVGAGVAGDEAERDTVTVLEAQLDDATGQSLAYAGERLLEAGALDSYIVPIIMKKGRPGQLLTVLCRAGDVDRLEALMLAETGTFGVRRHAVERVKLARRHATVETRFGPMRIKLGERGGALVRAWPEYEDCAAVARRTGVPLREVQQEVLRAWSREHDVPEHRV